MLHCSQIIWKEDSMGEKEGRNTRVLSLFVRLSYGFCTTESRTGIKSAEFISVEKTPTSANGE